MKYIYTYIINCVCYYQNFCFNQININFYVFIINFEVGKDFVIELVIQYMLDRWEDVGVRMMFVFRE